MAVFELHIPPHFFDSAKAENHFESVSERIAKVFLSNIMSIAPLARGDDKQGEPDYICGEDGYEVAQGTLLCALRCKPFNDSPHLLTKGYTI